MNHLANVLLRQAHEGVAIPPALKWLAFWLPDADRRILTPNDQARLDAYGGSADDLHGVLATLPALRRPIWCEAPIKDQGGAAMTMGYGAVAADDGLDIGWTCYAPEQQRMLGPFGPARVRESGLSRPEGLGDDVWRSLRYAAGIVLRVLLLDAGHTALTPGQRLRRACQTLGWSSRDAATRLGCDPRLVQLWWADTEGHAAPDPVVAWVEDLADYVRRHPAPTWKPRQA